MLTNKELTDLAEPFWLKDAQKEGEFFDVNGFSRTLLAAAKPVSILNPVDVDPACVQAVDEEFFNLLTNSDDFHKAAMTYRSASVGDAPAAYEALVRAAKPVSVDAMFPYQKTFDAIAAATEVQGGHVAISVIDFRKAFGASVSIGERAALQDIGHEFGCPAGVKTLDWLKVMMVFADRYQWLRDRSNDIEWPMGAGWDELSEAEGAEFDSIIDKARGKV